jgi:serine/threonine protein kinase
MAGVLMKPLAQNTLIQNRYLIVQLIGKGGMGEVYLAVDQRLGSAVALKRTFFAGDEMLGTAFEREARTLARMRHPVLPKVSDHFGENDEQYLVMEHISGDDLAKRLEAAGKPFPVSWVLYWADQLLDALSYLHTHEPPIIHRDIKPQNLKLTDENHIVLLDFGLSKTSTGQTNISQSGSTGSVVGYTPHYAPMEQIRGIGTSPRSDLYSLSATLYQLLTNSVPVDALSRADSLLNGLPDPIVPATEINPDVPKVISDVLLRAMEVSQEKRFANAREMQRVLRKVYNEIHQATTANTVAFSAAEAQAMIGADQGSGATVDSAESVAGVHVSEAGNSSQPVERAIEPGEAVDLDATMAYGTPFPSGDFKQSHVKTEVFLSGTSVSSAKGPEESAGPGPDVSAQRGDAPPVDIKATAPYIAVGDMPELGPVSQPDTPTAPEFFSDESAPENEEGDGPSDSRPATTRLDPAYASSGASYSAAVAMPAPAAKSSSARMLVILGGIGGLLLLGLGLAGGIWAYLNYSGANAVVEPSPTPEEIFTPSPTPEPTVEIIANVDDGNLNSNSNVNTNTSETNSNDGLYASPAPSPAALPGPERPSTGEPAGKRPERDTSKKPGQAPPKKPGPKGSGTPFQVLP